MDIITWLAITGGILSLLLVTAIIFALNRGGHRYPPPPKRKNINDIHLQGRRKIPVTPRNNAAARTAPHQIKTAKFKRSRPSK